MGGGASGPGPRPPVAARAQGGLSIAARGEDVHAAVEQLGVKLILWNNSTTSDCAVAIYASETPPDAGALYAIDPGQGSARRGRWTR